MKQLAIIISLNLGVLGVLQAQTVKKTAPQKLTPHLTVFYQAVKTGDINTAVMALNYHVAEQGGSGNYADTLAMLYMQQGAYSQCYYWADKRLQLKPEDVSLMEMKAICLDKMRQPTEAISLFEKLFRKTQSPFHAYKLMELQYGLKRLMECVATADAAERLTYKPEYVMPYVVGEQTGRTYLQAGVYNIHALALYDLDKKAEAKQYFQKALALDSNFALAKQNLEAMKAIESGAGKTAKPAGTPDAPPANKQ